MDVTSTEGTRSLGKTPDEHTMGDHTLLIIPGGYGDGPALRASAAHHNQRVIGASSVEDDPAGSGYDAWFYLPHVSSPDFIQRLAALAREEDVGHIHASHYLVWSHLSEKIEHLQPGVRLTLGRNNFDIEVEYSALQTRVSKAPHISGLEAAGPDRAPLSQVTAAGFIRAALSIPGESYEDKFFAMVEAARRAPQGDIVEIGSLFGRSAAFLAMLAAHYGLGSILCIDPWSKEEIDQDNTALQAASLAYDWQAWRMIFEINLAPYAAGRLNYMQATSSQAYERYGLDAVVTTEAFGSTAYQGQIALLHLDGNHGLEHVRRDAELWTPLVVSGGWIIFDDYEWDWGDGPKQIADAFLQTQAARIRTHFLAGGAMFIQLA